MSFNDVMAVFCLITIFRLIATAIHCHVRKDFKEPELIVARAFVWPVFDVLWLARRWRAWWRGTAVVIVAIAAASVHGGCAYEAYLYALPVTPRAHGGEAIGIVADVYGIGAKSPEVRWIVQKAPIVDEDNHPVLGVTHDCTSWVWWPPFYGDDPVHQTTKSYSHTVMAHEIAHCALWLYTGDGDGNHSDVEWWGPSPPPPGQEPWIGGLVGVAMKALEDSGL